VKLIVGLGNPGRIYARSRHNIGNAIVRALAREYGATLKKEPGIACLSGKCKIGGQNIVLALPLTFMNLSGLAVSAMAKKYKPEGSGLASSSQSHKIELNNLLVVCDDLDLEFGRLKIKWSGSSGGHRGIKSIVDSVKSNAFCRLRIGIGRPSLDLDAAEYVLSSFAKKEKIQLIEITQRALDCCNAWVVKGVNAAMNIFNGAEKKEGVNYVE